MAFDADGDLSTHHLFGVLSQGVHAVTLRQFLLFTRPLLTNSLSLADAFAVFVNAAAGNRVDALASGGGSAKAPALSFDGFDLAFKRLAQL